MYSRVNKYLQLPNGGDVLPARISQIGTGRTDAIYLNTTISHTASVPRHTDLAEDMTLFDGTYYYLVVVIEEVFGKYRLRLERLR